MNRGLASLPVKHFRSGGFGVSMSDPATTTAPAIDAFGLFSPVMDVSTPIGTFGVSPASLAAMAVPAIGPAVTAINAMNALAAMNAQQAPAPISSVEGQIAQTVAQEAVDAVDAAEGLAAMNAANEAAQAAESSATADAAATAAMADAVADSVAAADAADAAAAAAGDAGAGGAGGDGAGGDGGAAGGDGGAGAGDGGSSGDGSGGERAGGIIAMRHRYAQGGMPDVARHVQSQGRGDDKVLVHMTPSEVQGLQYLAMRHGGSLTINPRTGLVEAGFLSSILPMVAGAALTATGVGAPYAALMVGGGMTLATGSLKKGLLAGLGAFGGAGLAGGLTAAGATAPAVTGTSGALAGAGEVAAADIASRADLLGIAPGVGPGIAAPPAAGMVPGMSATNAAQYFGAGAPGAETFAGIAPPPPVPTTAADIAARADALGIAPGVGPGIAPPPPAPPTFGQNLQQMGTGFKNIFDFESPAGTEARKAFLGSAATKTAPATGVGGMPGLLRYGGAAAAPMLAAMAGPDQSVGGGKGQAYVRPFKYEPGRQDVTYRTGAPGESTSEQLYFSPRFTPMGVFKPGEEPTYGSYAMGGGVNMGGRIDPDYNENVDRNAAFSDDFYGGGLTALAAGGKPKEPRFLMGKGDGMSDSIPATINDVQPARLADGEFVIPADVVSHLGNGSSKAGAAKLHSMMKRIRQARTGKKRQAPEVKAERYMPA